MSVRSADADSRENSPDHEGSPGGKRTSKKRKVLSCYACRNRKMKCDRVYPVCGRCKKTGRSDQCTYDPRLLEDSMGTRGLNPDAHHTAITFEETGAHSNGSGTASLDVLRSKARAQERRIEELERKLAATEGNDNPSFYRDSRPAEPEIKEQMMFRGKGFKTQFHGSTSVMSTIAQFRELQAFTREALTVDHSIMRIKTDFKMFRDRRKTAHKHLGNRIWGTDDEIFAVLPNRVTINPLVELYFQTCEPTYKILHEPSFLRDYAVFWEQKEIDLSPPGFAVMLLLIVATTKCLKPKNDIFEGDTASDRHSASNIIDMCDAWINRQPRKRLTLQFFQLRCLSVIAKRINCVQLKQDWVTTGDLMRLALASGMHRDPSLLATGKISAFEKEMKRRLWVTIMELEMQSSIENGIQSMLTALYWDTQSPTNLPDDAFTAEAQELPASRPLASFTSASYLSVSRQSIPLRLHLMQLLSDPSEKIPYSEILNYDAQVNELLSGLPKWDDAQAVIPSVLLRLQLQQFLIMLHKPRAQMASKNDRYVYSFTTCINAAGSIITTYDELVTKGSLALNNMRNDVIRVGLDLSRIVYHNCALYGPIKSSAPPPPFREQHFADSQSHFADIPSVKDWAPGIEVSLAILPRESFLAQTLCSSAIELLGLAGNVYEHKVMRLGTGYMEFWLLFAAIGMLPAPSSAKLPASSTPHIMNPIEDLRTRCKITLDRFQTMAFRVLALQKDPETAFASSLRTTMASVSPSDIRTPSTGAGPAVTSTSLGTTPLPANDGTYQVDTGTAGGMGIHPGIKDMNGAFDNLQDMQVDLEGWNFPDFWAFDLGGDF